MKPITPESALQQMAALCARSEQCSFEILQKLKRKGLFPDEIKAILNKLIANKFVDDRRYAVAFAHDKNTFLLWGRNKIRTALMLKRIPNEYITHALSELDPDEYLANCIKAAESKAKSLDLTTPEDRAKLIRSLAAKGFEYEVIKTALQSMKK